MITGCAVTLNSSVPFHYVPSLTASEPNAYRLGVDKLRDQRPDEDRETTEHISDVDEKITSKLIDDLQKSNLFARVSYPPRKDSDDFALQGEIRRFYWKASPNALIWIPIINLLIYFGAPAAVVESYVGLHVRLTDSKSGTVVGEYKKFASRQNSYSIYDNLQAGEAGAELADALREVVKTIKEEMLADLRKHREVVK